MTRSECPVDADFQGVKHAAGRNEIHSCRQECQSCPEGMGFIPACRNANPAGALLAAGQLLGLPWGAAGAMATYLVKF